jgi:hypothetical protein
MQNTPDTHNASPDDRAEMAWAVYQMCIFAFMQCLSEPLRRGEEHCVGPVRVYLPANIEAALDVAIQTFNPGQPTMRNGNNLFGSAPITFDAERFKFDYA